MEWQRHRPSGGLGRYFDSLYLVPERVGLKSKDGLGQAIAEVLDKTG